MKQGHHSVRPQQPGLPAAPNIQSRSKTAIPVRKHTVATGKIGFLAATQIPAGGGTYYAAVMGDFNGDGKPDIASEVENNNIFTQFGRMCEKLGIGIIAASSPQAKGRIERANGVHQDRLIKKMRRKKIAGYEAANQYLQKQYLPEHNRRFARPPASPEDYHGRKPSARELHEIFRLETERSISHDWVIRHHGRSLQLNPGSRHYGPTRSKAMVCEWEDGNMQIYYRGEPIAFTELKERIQVSPELRPSAPRPVVIRKARKDHPWRQGYQNMRPRVPTPASAAPLVGMRPNYRASLQCAFQREHNN